VGLDVGGGCARGVDRRTGGQRGDDDFRARRGFRRGRRRMDSCLAGARHHRGAVGLIEFDVVGGDALRAGLRESRRQDRAGLAEPDQRRRQRGFRLAHRRNPTLKSFEPPRRQDTKLFSPRSARQFWFLASLYLGGFTFLLFSYFASARADLNFLRSSGSARFVSWPRTGSFTAS